MSSPLPLSLHRLVVVSPSAAVHNLLAGHDVAFLHLVDAATRAFDGRPDTAGSSLEVARKVVDVVAAPGAAVKKGDPVVVLEIMKMETPVVAPQDGTVVSVDVTKGETVESGAVLATMNA